MDKFKEDIRTINKYVLTFLIIFLLFLFCWCIYEFKEFVNTLYNVLGLDKEISYLKASLMVTPTLVAICYAIFRKTYKMR